MSTLPEGSSVAVCPLRWYVSEPAGAKVPGAGSYSSVVVGISVGMLHALMRTEATGRDRVPQARVLARLAEQFRSDVGAAVRQVPGTRQGEWQFVLPGDRLITYRALPGEIEWRERRAGKRVRQESYVLPSGCLAAITVRSKAKPAVLSLVIAQNGTPLTAGREIQVTAVLGKDHRFTKSPVGGQ